MNLKELKQGLDTLQALVEVATDEQEGPYERAQAAMAACDIIQASGLIEWLRKAKTLPALLGDG